MKGRRFAFILILTGVVALSLIGFGSLLSKWRVAYVNTEGSAERRFIVNARPSGEESMREVFPSRLALDLPVEVPRLPILDGFNPNPGQTIILTDHRLASISDFARSSLCLAFRLAGIVLLAMGAAMLFRQRYKIVEKDPPVEKA
ncbi:MAG: hypothetical protein WA996_08270 [Candidatus Promineifilaceae bacterium]